MQSKCNYRVIMCEDVVILFNGISVVPFVSGPPIDIYNFCIKFFL